ncbi:MAG TPA: hypothetical protein VKB70_02695, partial [Gaiellaceae bacterium]|nr:hypothetical protein [Gaiellaceae bacterium]
MRLRLLAPVVIGALGLVAAGFAYGASSGAAHSLSSAAVKTRKVSGLGVILVNPGGRTLYV